MSRLRGSTARPPTLPQLWRATLDEAALSAGWSASGSQLAAASASGTVYLFDAATGASPQRLAAHRVSATQVAWHPQDARLATAGQDGCARLWNAGRGELVKELPCGAAWVEHIAWSDSGRLLATAAGRKLTLWSSEGERLLEYPDHPATIAAIAWRRGAEELVSACYGQLQLWAPDSPRSTRALAWKGSMLSLAWSPDGRYLCHGNQDATVRFWILATGQDLQMSGYPTKVRELAWESRSRYLATGGGTAITIWDCSGKGPADTTPAELHFHHARLTHLAYQHSGGALASGCEEGQLAVWTPGQSAAPVAVARLPASISGISWSPGDKRIAAFSEDGTVAAYRLPDHAG